MLGGQRMVIRYTPRFFKLKVIIFTILLLQRHLTGNNMGDADGMELINQNAVYLSCGQKIKNDLMGGNAVVLFAYGLSGSGKTFTVFGEFKTTK